MTPQLKIVNENYIFYKIFLRWNLLTKVVVELILALFEKKLKLKRTEINEFELGR